MSFEHNDMKHLSINLENYEEYFLLYVDNELTDAEKKDVEVFVDQHPELSEEWMMLMDTKLVPDEITMDFKNQLYRSQHSGSIHESNYEAFQLSWIDNELSEKEKLEIANYTSKHPEAAANLELLLATKLPAEEIAFPDKSVLYRSAEKPAIVISMKWYRVAIAAAILIGAGLWFINKPDEDELPIDQVTVAQGLSIENGSAVNTNSDSAEKNKVSAKENLIPDYKDQKEFTETNAAENNKNTEGQRATKNNKSTRSELQQNNVVEEKQLVAKTTDVSNNSVEKLTNNRTQDLKNMTTDPMVSTTQINNQQVVALHVKSDYATDALNMENNNIPEKIETVEGGKSRKGLFRGIVRKANRYYNKVTNPDPERSFVKVANFEIGLPR